MSGAAAAERAHNRASRSASSGAGMSSAAWWSARGEVRVPERASISSQSWMSAVRCGASKVCDLHTSAGGNACAPRALVLLLAPEAR